MTLIHAPLNLSNNNFQGLDIVRYDGGGDNICGNFGDRTSSHHLRGSEWIMHIPVEGYLEELTEKVLNHLVMLTVESISSVKPSYVTVLDGQAREMPFLAECCIGFTNVDAFREFLYRHVEGGQDSIFCGEVMTKLRKAVHTEVLNQPTNTTTLVQVSSSRGTEVRPPFDEVYRMITKKGTCAPMTIRSQLDKNTGWVRSLNRREVLALRSFLEACLRRGKEVTWAEFVKHVPTAVNSSRSNSLQSSTARTRRGSSLESRRESSILTTGADESKMWHGRGRGSESASPRLGVSTMASSLRRGSKASTQKGTVERKKRGSVDKTVNKGSTINALHVPLTGASMDRHQHVERDEIHHHHHNDQVTIPVESWTSRREAAQNDASERIQPRVVDTWVDPTSVQPGQSSVPVYTAPPSLTTTTTGAAVHGSNVGIITMTSPRYPRLSSPTTSSALIPGPRWSPPPSYTSLLSCATPLSTRPSLSSSAAAGSGTLWPFLNAILMPSPMGLVYQRFPPASRGD